MALPLAAHLLSRRTGPTVYFPATRFVLQAAAERARRHRLRDVLLLLTRLLAVLLVALAFDRPTWSARAVAASKDASLELIVVIDASASMTRVAGGRTLFDAACERAEQAIRSLDPAKDAAGVVFAGLSPRPVLPRLSSNFPALHRELREAAPTLERADMASAVATACAMPSMLAPDERGSAAGHRRIVVLSDLQRSNWMDAALDHALPDGVELMIQSVAPPTTTENLGVIDIAVTPIRPVVGQSVLVSATVANFSDAPRRAIVNVSAGGATRDFAPTLAPWGRATVNCEAVFTVAGLHPISAAVTDEEFGHDDVARAVVRTCASRRVGLITSADRSDTSLAPYYLEVALRPGEGSIFEPVHLTPAQVEASALAGLDALIIAGALEVSDGALRAIAAFVSSGGGLLWVLDSQRAHDAAVRFENVDPSSAQLPAHPVDRFVELPPNQPLWLGEAAENSAALVQLAGPAMDSLLRTVFYSISPARLNTGATALLTFDTGEPALAVSPVGMGRVMTVHADLSPARCSLVKSPLFPVLLQELMKLLSEPLGGSAESIFWTVGHPILFSVPADLITAEPLKDSAGRSARVLHSQEASRPRFGAGDRENVGISVAPAVLPGFLTVHDAAQRPVAQLAANLDPEESDFRSLAADEDEARMLATGAGARASRTDVTGELGRVKPVELWPSLLAAAVLVLACEALLTTMAGGGRRRDKSTAGRLCARPASAARVARRSTAYLSVVAAAILAMTDQTAQAAPVSDASGRTAGELHIEPVLEPMLLALILGASAAAAVFAAVRVILRTGEMPRGVLRSFALRIAALGCIGCLLLNPSRTASTPDELDRPGVVLLVDRSQSMSLPDESLKERACTRFDALRAAWLEPNTIARLEANAQVRFAAFDGRVEPATLESLLSTVPDGNESRLARSLEMLLGAASAREGSRRVSDIVVLSDGIDTDGRSLAPIAPQAVASGVRIHAFVPGADAQPPDVSLSAMVDNPLVYEGQPVSLKLRIRQRGYEGRSVRLVVREISGESGSGEGRQRLITERTIVLDSPMELDVPLAPAREAGSASQVSVVEYAARVEPLPGEADVANNERRVFVQVTAERIRVCLFEAEPYWDSRFFISALRNDPQVELTTVHALGFDHPSRRDLPRVSVTRYLPGAAGSSEQTGLPAPLSEAALNAFDVVVLGRGIDAFFPGESAAALARFVTDRGGSLILLRGAPVAGSSPDAVRSAEILASVSPVEWGNAQLRAGRLVTTPEGRRLPPLDFSGLTERAPEAVLSELPGMLAATEIVEEKALSVVWLRRGEGRNGSVEEPMTTRDDPAAVAHVNVGRGRTLAVLTEGMWRWSFLPAELDRYSSVYQLFWSRAVRWLALGGEFLPGQAISLSLDRVSTPPGEAVTVIVRTREINPGRFEPRVRVFVPSDPGGEQPREDGSHHAAPQELNLERSATDPSRFTAVFVPEREGVHTVELQAPGMHPDRLLARFAVYDDRVELVDTAARPELMKQLAEATGGRLLGTDGADQIIDVLRREAQAKLTSRVTRPAWDQFWIFALIVGIVGVDWFWRRRVGLP